jgi:hypothetical protein
MITDSMITVEAYSPKTLGIKAGDEWYNVPKNMTDEARTTIKELLNDVPKGSVVKLTLDANGCYTDIELIEKGNPDLMNSKPSFMSDYIGFDDLLKKAHDKFPTLEIDTELLEHDFKDKRAVFRAIILIGTGEGEFRGFTGHGDASQENVSNSSIAKHYLRMAETGAIARALRFLMGESTVKEEL